MELASRADQRVLRLFGHMERMDEYRMSSPYRSTGKTLVRLHGWREGGSLDLDSRGMTMDAGKDRKEWTAFLFYSTFSISYKILTIFCLLLL